MRLCSVVFADFRCCLACLGRLARVLIPYSSCTGYGLLPAGKQAEASQPESGTFHNDALLGYVLSAMDLNRSSGLFATRTLVAYMTPAGLLASRPVLTRLMVYTLIDMPRTMAPAAVVLHPMMGLMWFLDKQMPAIDLKSNATEALQVRPFSQP